MIHFNLPPVTGDETKYIEEAIAEHKICGDGRFTSKCSRWMEEMFDAKRVLLTTSGSTALDMALMLCDLQPGDEVILPSYTFSSTANAAVLCGARLVFVDIDPATMNMNERLIEEAVTERTKVIIVMHYAGVACDMDIIMDIARRHHLKVVEDAAQAIFSSYKDRYLGTIGDFGCFSFHETKNLSMGEGGALIINDEDYIERAEILREKGTNRSKFFRGEVDKYSWVDFGGSYLPSDINAAYLWAGICHSDEINNARMRIWKKYRDFFEGFVGKETVSIPFIPAYARHNAHMFYIKLRDFKERTRFIKYFRDREILTPYHYVPLHSAPAGRKYGRFCGDDRYTTIESERLARLPLYFNMTDDELDTVIDTLVQYFA